MKTLWAILVVLILLLQVRMWIGEGSFAQGWSLENSIAEQRAEDAGLAARNDRRYAEVRNQRNEQRAAEERARMDRGLIRDGETCFVVAENGFRHWVLRAPGSVSPGTATSTSMCASLRPSMAFEIPGETLPGALLT